MSETLSSWLDKLEKRHPKSIDLGLDRCSAVYQNLGSPEPAPRIITVGGTNGKGSVVAYLSAILIARGFRCASYTSPHLLTFNERVRIDNEPVSDEALIKAFESTEAALNDTSLTYFEFTTLAAFQLMNHEKPDFAVLEVGLGGRLDTVNLVDPDCAVITNIALDHQQFLGNDRESIGFEKSGIMRKDIPVVCGDRHPPDSLVEQAASRGSHLHVLGQDFDHSAGKDAMSLKLGNQRIEVPPPAMTGEHQRDNLAIALAAIHYLDEDILKGRWAWKKAVSQVRLRGRLYPLPTDPRIVIDVGHNPHAARVVTDYLADDPCDQVICVLGMLRDKEAGVVAGILDSEVDHWLCAGLPGSRGQSGEALARKIASVRGRVSNFTDVCQAMAAARDRAGTNDRILVFGSFETAAAALRVSG